MTTLNITITDAGRAELINAVNTGTDPVVLAEAGLGTGEYTPTTGQTALVAEHKRVNTIAGAVVADDILHVTVRDESTDAYDVREIGLYTDNGTLFAVYSQSGNILQKAAGSAMLMAFDIALDTLDANSLTFGDLVFVNPPATESTQGVAKIATQQKTNDGEDDETFVTPKKLKALLGDSLLPAGTRMLFVQSAAPIGWTKVTTHDNKALRVVSGNGGGVGGSVDFTAAFKNQLVSGSISSTTATGSVSVSGHTLSTSQMPAHKHNIKHGPYGGDPETISSDGWNGSGNYSRTRTSLSAGGNGSHNHGASFTGNAHSHGFSGTAINMAVKYVDTIIAQKD
ncbi:phage tail protein [Motiliproteus sp.]|uniref:phage tail-collar fiber domain-containing protein n=1 Tax=Motiliproteus sp. TaxID=1898955 RepID=UPI003BAAD6AF